MKHTRWKTHVNARCLDCDFMFENDVHGVKQAYNHAKQTGHTIHGETGFAFTYN